MDEPNERVRNGYPSGLNSKRLEPGSELAKYDADGDGIVSDAELETSERLQKLEVEHERADAQRGMCWFALLGMLLYPSLIMISSFFNMKDAAVLLSDMSSMYFLATSGVVSVFFSAMAYSAKNNK